MLKRRTFSSNLSDKKLGISSRGGMSTTVKVSQKGWDDKPLDTEAVGKQSFVLESTGKNALKIRGAYHKNSPLCAYIKNEPTDKTTERRMPAPFINLKEVNENEIPESAKATIKGNRIVDFNYKKTDEAGNVTAEVIEENGKFYKVEYNVPLYKQYFTDTYEPISEKKAEGSDERGNYILVDSPFNYVALVNIGFFTGHQVDKAGNKIKGTEGVYMVEGGIDEKYFSRIYPQRSGAKVSIGNRIGKVFGHPMYGVIKESDLSAANKLKKGKFTYDANAVNIAIYNEDNEVAAVLLDRAAYKVGQFKAKTTRGETSVEDTIEDMEVAMDTNSDKETINEIEDLI